MYQNSAIPRMRTVPKIVSEIKVLDPDTEVTGHWVRQLVKIGTVPIVWAGCKALVNLDDVLTLLYTGTEKKISDADTTSGIRRIRKGRV